MKRLEGKVALITGGGIGIGEAIAKLFAQEGAAVVITGRRKEVLERVAHKIERQQGRALPVAGSVSDESHARTAVALAVQTFGKLNVLVNNAGIGAFGKLLHETDDTTWDDLLATNVTGIFRMTRAAIPAILKAGGGSIVNLSSIAAQVGIPLTAGYSATKGAVDALTRCMAIDYAEHGIRCNTLSPGLVDTPMAAPLINDRDRLSQVMSSYPLGRPGKAEEVARLALYLASDESAWVTGSTFTIDGGMTAR